MQELQAQIQEVTQTLETLQTNLAALRAQRSVLAEQLVQVQEGFYEIADAYVTLHEAQTELNDGWAEYEDGRSEYESKIAEGQQEIDDAINELEKLEKPSYYLLTRNENIGYVSFDNDSSIVAGMANVFPVFFFLVAALVCITTMNRMVEEQRTQIGVLKALGYSKAAIMGKYMVYSGSAAMIGCISGFLIGSYVFPNVIWTVYGIMYSIGGSGYLIDVPLACISVVVALICSIGTTWLSCRMELGSVAAELIRPKTPKAGKRIFLEYIPFIWKRMKFLHKVSARNIFRYKKRFFMMVLGVGGCTALLLTGLGIKDSIADEVTEQYDRNLTYDK
ncbi:MAG: FtsX-like permease family protein, partial [Lachnospiraceae bacterium]|nr:FtsX-like permease family protein [Lachnospiraceae bacterium]